MSFSLQDALTAARDRSPWFRRERVTDAVVARFLSDYQNALIVKMARRDRQSVQQTLSIVLALSTANTPGTAGPGTLGGLPATVADDGSLSISETSAGALVEAATAAGIAAVQMTETVVSSATSTTTTCSTASRTSSADVGALLIITAGKGIGQVRQITANTTTQWTHAAWATIPDTTSMVEVITASLSTDESANVVTSLPVETSQTGYLVRRTSTGTPYIDYTAPLTASVEAGVSLPSLHAPIDGTVRYTDGTTDPLVIASADERFRQYRTPTVYFTGQTLHLIGETDDWSDVASVELHYTPVAPSLTRRTDLFLVPDAAKPAVIAHAAAFMAERVADMPDVEINPAPLLAWAGEMEQTYLKSLTLGLRGRTTTIREAW